MYAFVIIHGFMGIVTQIWWDNVISKSWSLRGETRGEWKPVPDKH